MSRETVQPYLVGRARLVRNGVAPSGSPKRGTGSSTSALRIGSVTELDPVHTDNCAGSGGGHANGQYDDDTDNRMRCPARKRCAMALQSTFTRHRRPGVRGRGFSCPSRWVRLNNPYVTRVALPSGRTSDNRTATMATGLSAAMSNVTVGAPRISTSCSNGSVSNTREPPSSSRWSYGRSGGALYDAHLPANRPTDSGDCTVSLSTRTSSSSPAMRCRASGNSTLRTCGEGQPGSPTQRPGRS